MNEEGILEDISTLYTMIKSFQVQIENLKKTSQEDTKRIDTIIEYLYSREG